MSRAYNVYGGNMNHWSSILMAANLNGKTILVTGATNGIGKVTARELARMGAHIVIVGRNPAKTEEAVREIKTAAGHDRVEMLLGDLSVMGEVARVADEYRARYPRLDVLVNNAGAYFQQRQTTKDGLEMTFALNHMSYFILTNRLLDVLKASAPARIVNVSSEAHRQWRSFDFDDLQSVRYGVGGFKAYGQSKLANVLFTAELARHLGGTGVTANSLHPGLVSSGFGKNNGGLVNLAMRLISLFAINEEQGAQTSLYVAASPEVEGVTGKYFDKSRMVAPSPASQDEAAQKRLWQISEEIGRAYLPQAIAESPRN
jgi:NAD(P)-dependent dehydrogenase (short-subunit alcohol dehydrogenase family)